MELELNRRYVEIIAHVVSKCDRGKYIILGSAATLSYTSKVGYTRKMNDLDIVADESQAESMIRKLIKMGFIQTTFIDKRMPFYRNLMKYSESFYLRFNKEDINIEILSTRFINTGSRVKFDLYPGIWVEIPMDSLVESVLDDVRFVTIDVNLLWAIKQVLNNTLGRVVLYKTNQRKNDLKNLRLLINIEKARFLLSKCKLGFGIVGLKVPSLLIC